MFSKVHPDIKNVNICKYSDYIWFKESIAHYSPRLAFRQDGCLYLSRVLIERECNDTLRPLQYRGQHLLPWWPINVSTVLVNSSHWATLKIDDAADYSKRFNDFSSGGKVVMDTTCKEFRGLWDVLWLTLITDNGNYIVTKIFTCLSEAWNMYKEYIM